MPRGWGRAAAGVLLALALLGCGKKAPLRLPSDRPVDKAPGIQAVVREGAVTLNFRVPRHRLFPEREEPWVLARVLRQTAPARDSLEAGSILEPRGFEFDAPLSFTDPQLPPGRHTYRVEFRDGERRRRALSDPLVVAWDRAPDAPAALTASGAGQAVVLSWAGPAGGDGVRFRIYRRSAPQADWQPLTPEAVAGNRFVDSMVEAGRGYCYLVRAILVSGGVEIEGPAATEACATPFERELPPEQPPAAVP